MMEEIKRLTEVTDKCINCGFCESVCPTYAPAEFISSFSARGRMLIGKELSKEIAVSKRISKDVSDYYYSCLGCNACLQVCPAKINAGEVSDLVRKLVVEGKTFESKQRKMIAEMIVHTTMKYNNPLGLKKELALWARGLSFFDDSPILFYTGGMYQMMPYSQTLSDLQIRFGSFFSSAMARLFNRFLFAIKVSKLLGKKSEVDKYNSTLKDIYTLLSNSGVKLSYLGADEPYPGTFINDLGYTQEFKSYASRVTELFKSKGIREIVVVDPHTYQLMKYEYPKVVPEFDLKVTYYLDKLDRGILKRRAGSVTYHEPCLIARGIENYEIPFEILNSVAKVKLPRKNGKNTSCCGGPDGLLFPSIAKKISEDRSRELKREKSDRIVSLCPICISHLGVNVEITDLSTFLIEATNH